MDLLKYPGVGHSGHFCKGHYLFCNFGYQYLACKAVDKPDDPLLGLPLMACYADLYYARLFITTLHQWKNPLDIISRLMCYLLGDEHSLSRFSEAQAINYLVDRLLNRDLLIFEMDEPRMTFSGHRGSDISPSSTAKNTDVVLTQGDTSKPAAVTTLATPATSSSIYSKQSEQAGVQKNSSGEDVKLATEQANAELLARPLTQQEVALTAEQRKERYQQRQALIARTAGAPEIARARERLAFNNDNILRAEAADYVYRVDEFNRDHIKELPPAPVGLELLDAKQIPGMEGALLTSKETGFGAALFKSSVNDETMLTYRGTNNDVTGKKDWKTNFRQGTGKETAQYNQAMDLADITSSIMGNEVSIVGHSLGGGLASAGVAVSGNKGYTFNAAGLHPNTAKRYGGLSNEDAGKLITTQAVSGEVLTGAQKHGNKAVTGIAGTAGFALGGPLGAAAAIIAQKAFTDDVPQAIGKMKPLPSVNGGNPVTRHAMEQVITGIEAQKEEDKAILNNHIKAYYGD
ncbi:Mbeg1-like protein [Thalassomonas actiniarum]|nr:Mbeg1-like protein [Thalassomonas actiniarum]